MPDVALQLSHADEFVFSNQIFKWAKHALIPLLTVLTLQLAGCATRDPNLDKTLSGLKIVEVRVDVSEKIRTGGASIEGIKPDEQVKLVMTTLQNTANKTFPSLLHGERSSRMVLTIDALTLASPQGRVLLGSPSIITGTVRLEDARTGANLVKAHRVISKDHSSQDFGLVDGLLIRLVTYGNKRPTQEQLVNDISDHHIAGVRKWLLPNERKQMRQRARK